MKRLIWMFLCGVLCVCCVLALSACDSGDSSTDTATSGVATSGTETNGTVTSGTGGGKPIDYNRPAREAYTLSFGGLLQISYNCKGSILSIIPYEVTSMTPSGSGDCWHYRYDENNRLTEIIRDREYDDPYSVSYDDKGSPVSASREMNGKTQTVELTYDAKGRLLSEVYASDISREYDTEGNLVKAVLLLFGEEAVTTYSRQGIEATFTSNGIVETRSLTLNKKGYPVQMNDSTSDSVITWEYDKEDRCSLYLNHTSDILSVKIEYEHDKDGRIEKKVSTYYDKNGEITEKKSYEYVFDAEGNTIKDTTSTFNPKNLSGPLLQQTVTEIEPDGSYTKSTTHQYDDTGKLTFKRDIEQLWDFETKIHCEIRTIYDLDDGVIDGKSVTETYTENNKKIKVIQSQYDADGNQIKSEETLYS